MRRANNDAFSRCHPLVTFVFFLGAVGFGALIMHPAYILATVFFAVTYYILLHGVKGWKTVLLSVPLFIVVSFLNPLINREGQRVLMYVFGRPYTFEALIYGMVIAGMLIGMLLWAGCYNVVMTSDKFMALFGGVIPTISMLLLMVLRLIPNMIRKAAQIAGARRCIGRGAGDTATKKEKAIDSMNVVSALITWALEGGVITADSMLSRGYGTEKRTSFRIHQITALDASLLGGMAVMAAAIIRLIAGGGTSANYTPHMEIAPVAGRYTLGFAAYCAFLSLPTVLYIKETIQWHISRSKS